MNITEEYIDLIDNEDIQKLWVPKRLDYVLERLNFHKHNPEYVINILDIDSYNNNHIAFYTDRDNCWNYESKERYIFIPTQEWYQEQLNNDKIIYNLLYKNGIYCLSLLDKNFNNKFVVYSNNKEKCYCKIFMYYKFNKYWDEIEKSWKENIINF